VQNLKSTFKKQGNEMNLKSDAKSSRRRSGARKREGIRKEIKNHIRFSGTVFDTLRGQRDKVREATDKVYNASRCCGSEAC